jgi:hypothetical protein
LQYGGQDIEVGAAMTADARQGQLMPLLKDILKDAELRARSATLSRYVQEAESDSKSTPPGAWLLNRVTDLQRSILETDKAAADLKSSLLAPPVSETAVKRLVDLTGHRGWAKGTAEELMAIANDMEVSRAGVSGPADDQKRRQAVQELLAYQSARAPWDSPALVIDPAASPASRCAKLSLDGKCITP